MTRSVYSCIFYFVGNVIAGIEESLEPFLFSNYAFSLHVVGANENLRDHRIFGAHQIQKQYTIVYVLNEDGWS